MSRKILSLNLKIAAMALVAIILAFAWPEDVNAATATDCEAEGGTWVEEQGICLAKENGKTGVKLPTPPKPVPPPPPPPQGTTVPFPCAPQGSGDPLKGLGIPSPNPPKNPCPTLN